MTHRILGIPAAVAVLLLGGSAVAAPAYATDVFTPGSPNGIDSYFPQDGNGGYRVTQYDLTLRLDPETTDVGGTMVIKAAATQNLSSFNLDFSELGTVTAAVDGKPAATEFSGEHEMTVTPEKGIRTGSVFTTTITYAFNEQQEAQKRGLGALHGWVRSTSGGYAKGGEPDGAENWYPSNNTPVNKAPFTLTASVPSSWIAVGGGREGKAVESGGWTTKTWTEPNPVAMYLVPFAVDHFAVFRSTLPSGTPVVSAFAPDAGSGNAEARLPEILSFLESKLGKYPHVAAGGIFADPIREDIAFSALETQTRPYYTFSRDVEDDKRLAVVVHENTHEWYGDVVSVQQWRDICLNECFASYLPWMWSEEKEGKSIDKHYRDTVQKIWDDDKVWGNLLYDMCPGGAECSADEVFNPLGVYGKGPLALHALRRTIGDKAFLEILRSWPTVHKWGNATWPQFEAYVQKVAGKDLSGFFTAWFHSTTRPEDQYLFPGSLAQR